MKTAKLLKITKAWALRSSIEEFQAKYVTAVELASQLGTSSRKVVSLLRDRNTHLTSQSIDERRQYLFIRREAVAALNKKPHNSV